MGANFTDKDGQKKSIVMGCYGIGLGRLMAAIVEASHDKKGIIWPDSVAPFQIHLIELSANNKELTKAAQKLYQDLTKVGLEVLYDDRDKSAGEKLVESDLIGIPMRLVISEKTIAKKAVEVKRRESETIKLVEIGKLVSELKKLT